MDRNFILAIVLSAAMLLGWELFIAGPQREAFQAANPAPAPTAAGEASGEPAAIAGDASAAPAPDGRLSVDEALAATPDRIPIDTPSLVGSINLASARIDDLSLKRYRETLDPKSAMIRLLSPANTEHGHYLQLGLATTDRGAQNVPWTAPGGAKLTPQSPVTLTRRAGGFVFETRISIDDQFMFEVIQTARNEGGETASVTPTGFVIQRGVPEDAGKFMILHEGPISVVENSLFERKYKKATTAVVEASGAKGWIGITNKYWLAAAIPPQGEPFRIEMRNTGSASAPVFQASYAFESHAVAPGRTYSLTSHLFAGPKDVDVLQSYEKPKDKGGLGIWDFDRAVDWGNFWFLTRPIFATLNYFGDLTGNFGLAILILTLIVKALMFPLANTAYVTMSKMKKLQPEIQALQKRYADDKMKLQQEMMAVYQKEKMNPLAGCVPILIQMPIFYALYKTLFVTIELRHAPFALWIEDLSAPDPTSIFNLFGLIPYEPTAVPFIGAFLGIGVLPLLMGVGMWLQTKLNPPPTDPVQAQVFAMMPIIFTFLFASFASGLVLYWVWNTYLSILQQWYIMKRNGVSVNWAENMSLPWTKKLAAEKPSAGGK
jgi:YidC/Oxa1 family membrane protein insertase